MMDITLKTGERLRDVIHYGACDSGLFKLVMITNLTGGFLRYVKEGGYNRYWPDSS